jgi:hypothetical protein
MSSFKTVLRIKYFEEDEMIGIQRGWGRGGMHIGILVGKLEGKRPPRRSGIAREDNIKMDLYTRCDRMD